MKKYRLFSLKIKCLGKTGLDFFHYSSKIENRWIVTADLREKVEKFSCSSRAGSKMTWNVAFDLKTWIQIWFVTLVGATVPEGAGVGGSQRSRRLGSHRHLDVPTSPSPNSTLLPEKAPASSYSPVSEVCLLLNFCYWDHTLCHGSCLRSVCGDLNGKEIQKRGYTYTYSRFTLLHSRN